MTDQTPDLAALEALAEAATPGPWRCWNGFPLAGEAAELLDMHAINRIGPEDGGGILGGWSEDGDMYATRATAEFIATSDPQTVLWLIREVRDLRFEVAELERQLEADAKHAALGPGESCDVCTHRSFEEILADCESLSADMDEARVRAKNAEAELASIRAAARPDRFRCCECCKTEHLAEGREDDDLIDNHEIACQHCQDPEKLRAEDLARRALRAETALLTIAELADQIAEQFGDGWPHTPACQGEPGCPLCQITFLARGGEPDV